MADQFDHHYGSDSLDIELNKKLKQLHNNMKPGLSANLNTDNSGEKVEVSTEMNNKAVTELADSYKRILTHVGEDPAREGLLKTPNRAAKAMMYFTKGYSEQIEGRICNCETCLVFCKFFCVEV